jgi:uncharacterized protein (TIGR02217 family)
MAFLESPRFPESIAFGAVGGPEFSTTVVQTIGGKEQRTGHFVYPKQKWDVSPGVRAVSEMLALRSFFLNARGQLHGWRFQDLTDYIVTHSDGVVAAITSTTFQLQKKYVSGSQTMLRKIIKPVAAVAVEVKVSGSVVSATVDTTTGIVTISSAPTAANVTWAGQFDVPMRFDFDHMQASAIDRNADGLVHMMGPYNIVEVPR